MNPSEHGLFISRDHIMERVDDNQFKSLCGQHEQACRFPNNTVNATVNFKHPEVEPPLKERLTGASKGWKKPTTHQEKENIITFNN